ncbi:hypothetical protein TNCV_4646661 [Trichonephila clavipes]|uniref:Uncharacterized protein n=1 Tax=Trichonephila clavipes TaxID=2585209 RepID=A0A8X6VI32_TRICX|nr:hypothetical protein TNCV_4646661 [Trichonephila clavipes]
MSYDEANLYQDLILPRASNQTDTLGIFYMPYNHTTGPMSIFYIMKIHRLGPGSNSQPWLQKVSNKPPTSLSRHFKVNLLLKDVKEMDFYLKKMKLLPYEE